MDRTRALAGYINLIILLLFGCTAAGAILMIPERTGQALKKIVAAFEAASVGTIWTAAVIFPVALVALLVVGLATGLAFVKALYDRDRMRQARLVKAEREARIWFSELPAGGQLYKHELTPGSYTTPLHLLPGRSNGEPLNYSPSTWRVWQFNQLAHSTAKPGRQTQPLLEDTVTPASWPERVNLMELLPDGVGDLDNIVLGVTAANGALHSLAAPLEKMVHVAVGGASGWGKSEFLRAFAFQLATAPQPVQIALIDLEAATFSPFTRSDRLRYPIADTEHDILAILADLQAEIERRKELYAGYPTVDKLSAFNRQAADQLPVIVLLIDEATILLSENREIERSLKTHILRARKYGIYTVAGGQSWKSSDFDTTIRGQFSTTIHFQAKDKSSSRVLLGDSAAADIDRIGRAYAIVPGHKMIQIQAPALSLMAVTRSLPAAAVVSPPIMPAAPPPTLTRIEQQIWALHTRGQSDSAIARQVFNHDGGNQLAAVREIIQKIKDRNSVTP